MAYSAHGPSVGGIRDVTSDAKDEGTSGGGDGALRTAVEAQRASTEHWRRLAEQRTEALDELRRRPIVRAALAAEWRGRRATGAATALLGRARRRSAQARLVLAATPRRLVLATRRDELRRAVAALPPAHVPPRPVSVVVLGEDRGSTLAGVPGPWMIEVLRPSPGEGAASGAARCVDAATGELICLLATTSEPLVEDWLARLAGSLGDGVVAATPLLVHPARPFAATTPHDLRVRSEGVEVTVDGEGVPVPRARKAGSAPRPARAPVEVDASSSACLVVDRAACHAAGGLMPLGDDVDVAVVDLSARLRRAGGRTVCVPGAPMFDHRPVRSTAELTTPIDGHSPGWRAAIERRGPELLRMARTKPGSAMRLAITVASPTAKVATKWGDWHLAVALGGSLERLGHEVRLQTADQSEHPAGRCCDLHIVLRGLAPVRRTLGQRHLLWVISHPEAIDPAELDEADLVLVASRRFADALREQTTTPVEVLLQATDHRRFRPVAPDPAHRHPVTVVAKTRDVRRAVVADALDAGLRPAIYGSGWREIVDPSLVVADHVPNELLPVVYSSAGVVLNDHWDTMRAWGFISNRIFDVLACGAPLISDDLPEVAQLFGDAVPTYREAEELGSLVREALANPDQARQRAEAGRRAVVDHHTFDHRARTLLDLLARHRLDEPPQGVRLPR